jgi:hypothetical protein
MFAALDNVEIGSNNTPWDLSFTGEQYADNYRGLPGISAV